MKVICTFFLARDEQIGITPNIDTLGTGPISIIEITSTTTGKKRIVTICKLLTLQLEMGDKIKCLSGRTLLLINPNTLAGFIYLAETSEIINPKKWQNELTLNQEATKTLHRGKASFFEGMGNDAVITGASTR